MQTKLSVRQYRREMQAHEHIHFQLVLPLSGSITLEMEQQKLLVSPGECVKIGPRQRHGYAAEEQSRFLIADLHALPPALANSASLVIAISEPLWQFIHFAEKQLQSHLSPTIEKQTSALFDALLAEQGAATKTDFRISQVLVHIERNISEPLPLERLASIACLSLSQFKSLFKHQLSVSPGDYIAQCRMEKAAALLANTDTPISIVARQVGYQDSSSFTHKFKRHFALSPRDFRQKRSSH